MTGPHWSDKELELLREHYPKAPNSHIADKILINRTSESVSRKARRLELEKEEAFHFKWKIAQRSIPKIDIEKEGFIVGLTSGDGTFMKTKNGELYKFIYKIEMNHEHNEEMLRGLKEYFGCGQIYEYYRDKYDSDVIRYSIQSIPSHVVITIPVFDRNEMLAEYKRVQYQEWRSNLLEYIGEMNGQECRQFCEQVISDAQ